MYDEARELNAAEGHDLVPKEASIAIGDRLDTDIEAGNRGDYDSLAVLTGVTNPTELMLAPSHLRPTFIAPDLRELGEAQPEPVRDESGTWECRKASAWFENGQVHVSDPTSMDGLRAAVCAAWEAADQGAQLSEATVPGVRHRGIVLCLRIANMRRSPSDTPNLRISMNKTTTASLRPIATCWNPYNTSLITAAASRGDSFSRQRKMT